MLMLSCRYRNKIFNILSYKVDICETIGAINNYSRIYSPTDTLIVVFVIRNNKEGDLVKIFKCSNMYLLFNLQAIVT